MTIVVVGTAPVGAQSVDQSELQRCAGLQSSEARLACFEALADGGGSIEAEAPITDADKDAGGVVQEQAPPVPAVAPGDVHDDIPAIMPAAPAADSIAAPAPAEVVPSAEDSNAPANPAAPAGPKQADPADDFGSEQLSRSGEQDDDDVSITATVVEVSEGRHKVLHFRLANGQLWRQIEGRRFRYPKQGDFDVIISRGMMGDYRLRLDEDSPMTRIRRIE